MDMVPRRALPLGLLAACSAGFGITGDGSAPAAPREPRAAADADADADADHDSDAGTAADRDGDGWPNADDCEPGDATRYPGAPALCAGRTCGWDFCDSLCGGVACADEPSQNTVLQIVGDWYLPSTTDSMLVEDPAESPGGDFRGQLFYAADGAADGDTPLYRLVASAGQVDHMVSTDPTEGAPDYVLEGTLAHGWSAAKDGMDALVRYYSSSRYDHAAGFGSAAPAGYATEGALAWVYPRYGLADEDLATLSGAEVSLGLNRVAGGAAWSLRWGGVEFLSAYDFGRQLQVAFQMNGAGEADNPTEAGDAYAAPGDPEGWRHGSPLLDLSIDGRTVSTSTRPLQWLPGGFHAAAHDTTRNPVAWDGTFEKTIRLDHGGNPHVLAWTTTITFPETHGSLNIELATAYLPGSFDTFYTYDARTRTLADKTAGVPLGGCVDPSLDPDQRPEAGGVIVASASGSHALGVYRERPLSPSEGYGLCNFLYGETGSTDFSTSKWNLLERPPGGLDAGTYSWDFFLVVGTLADAVAAMDELHAR